jgi:hypothetical protein
MSPSLRPTPAILCAALFACGGAEPPPKAPEPAAKEEPAAAPRPLKTSSELGQVDPAAVKHAFSGLDEKFLECQKRALGRVELVAGNVKFFVRIGSDGSAKWSYLEESDLGDRETEKCLLDVVMNAQWPRPDSGDAEARYGMELPLQATRPPTDWGVDKVTAAITKHGQDIDKCKGGAGGSFKATLYVGTGGKVLAAGVATSAKDGAEKADCLADLLGKMRGLPSPGSWPAKVSFNL